MGLDNKVNLLYLIMGTNPFPNIIAEIIRMKNGGEVVCVQKKL